MARFTVTAAFTVDVPAGTSEYLVRNEAQTLLANTAARRNSSSWDGTRVTLDSVAVEVAPEPEPTITMTESELQAKIAECVAEALAESNPSNIPA